MNKIARIILFFFFLVIVPGCNNQDKTAEKKSESGVAHRDSSEAFLKLFPEVSKDTLHVYFGENNPEADKEFAGKELNPAFYRILLDFDSLYKYEISYGYHYFSCYKIKISKSKTGLIMRVPSQYSESAVDMFIWDNQSKKIVGCQNLSDQFGDGGWYFDREAWITDLNHDALPDIVQRQKDHDGEMDDPDSLITVTDSTHVFIWNPGGFQKSDFPVDSGKFQLKNWD
jgi:hypothetical protein